MAASIDPIIKQFAVERSHKDRQEQVEYGKALFQILIGSNGLAATALLTLAGAYKQPGLLFAIAFPTLLFLAGVYFGTLGVIELFLSKSGYGYAWQLRFHGERRDAERRERREALERDRRAVRWARWAARAFAAGVVFDMFAFGGWFWWLGGFTQPLLSELSD
jgi:hypothetical protein